MAWWIEGEPRPRKTNYRPRPLRKGRLSAQGGTAKECGLAARQAGQGLVGVLVDFYGEAPVLANILLSPSLGVVP